MYTRVLDTVLYVGCQGRGEWEGRKEVMGDVLYAGERQRGW